MSFVYGIKIGSLYVSMESWSGLTGDWGGRCVVVFLFVLSLEERGVGLYMGVSPNP